MPVVEAVGLAVPNRTGRAVKIEAAMKAALEKALKEGERRPHILRKRILEARAEEKLRQG